MSLVVTIEYMRSEETQWEKLAISPSEYFEPDEEPFVIDSVARSCHAIDYIPDLTTRDVRATRLCILDITNNQRRSVTEMFWNNGENRVIDRKDQLASNNEDRELIFDILISRTPYVSESLRVGNIEDLWQVLSHVFIERRPDGSEEETVVYSRA